MNFKSFIFVKLFHSKENQLAICMRPMHLEKQFGKQFYLNQWLSAWSPKFHGGSKDLDFKGCKHRQYNKWTELLGLKKEANVHVP